MTFLRRTLKRWCCRFTCIITRAEHIEVAQSLDTESCLASVTRFIARRGYPKIIDSYNGTNFVGALNELKAFLNEWDKAKLESDLAQKRSVWKFDPPGAPHFGGIWERLFQSFKKVMIAQGGLGQSKPCHQGTEHNNVSCKAHTQCKTPVSSKWRPWRLDVTHNKSFVPSSECYHDIRNSSKLAREYADMLWKRWTREDFPQWK